MSNDEPMKFYVPTRQWFATAVTGVLSIVVQAIASGGWDVTEWGALVTLVSALAGAYILRNAPVVPGVSTVRKQ